MKNKTSAQLKKELDRLFSLWIRTIHPARCYTCGVRKSRKHLQCGHFIPRNILITRWEPNNCRPQCVGCNVFGNGKILDFEDNLVKEIGRESVDKMKASRFKVFKVDTNWYLQQIADFKSKLDKL